MSEIKFKHGYVTTKDGTNVGTLEDALTQEAKCGCGINCCLGILTLTHAETGERMGLYIVEGETGPELVIEPYTDAIVNVKALYDART